jgi:hypothetical protein
MPTKTSPAALTELAALDRELAALGEELERIRGDITYLTSARTGAGAALNQAEDRRAALEQRRAVLLAARQRVLRSYAGTKTRPHRARGEAALGSDGAGSEEPLRHRPGSPAPRGGARGGPLRACSGESFRTESVQLA